MRDIEKDYREFLNAPEVNVPPQVSKNILYRMNRDLNPSFLDVLKKMLMIQLPVGLVTLAFCPQLGVGPFWGNYGMMMIFMRWGPVVCAGTCGALFYGLGAVAGVLFLTREELSELKRHSFLQTGIITAIAFLGLVLAGAEVARTETFAWSMGAILAGGLIYQAGAHLRQAVLFSFSPKRHGGNS